MVQMPLYRELLNLRVEKVMQWLLHLAQSGWEKEKVPEEWLRKKLSFPLYKKRLFHDCHNFRGIVSQSVRKSVLQGDPGESG